MLTKIIHREIMKYEINQFKNQLFVELIHTCFISKAFMSTFPFKLNLLCINLL